MAVLAAAKNAEEEEFWRNLRYLLGNPPDGFEVHSSGFFAEQGNHPVDFTDGECAFAVEELKKFSPGRILDIGSYRHFLIGLSVAYDVLCVDVRPKQIVPGEKRIVLDVRDLSSQLKDVDTVISLCTLEHIGLGRYGDEFDIDGDKKAFTEIKKVLKSGGHFIFTVPVTNGVPVVHFNAHRIYSYQMIQDLCAGLEVVEEKFFNLTTLAPVRREKITAVLLNFTVYCGHWRKV